MINLIREPIEVRRVKTSYSDNVRAERLNIPHTNLCDDKGNISKLRIFNTDRGLVLIKDNDIEVYYESDRTLKELGEIYGNN